MTLPSCFHKSTLKIFQSDAFSLDRRVETYYVEMKGQLPLPCSPLLPRLSHEIDWWDYRVEIDPEEVRAKILQQNAHAKDLEQAHNPEFPPKILANPFIPMHSEKFSVFQESAVTSAQSLRYEMEDSHASLLLSLTSQEKNYQIPLTAIFDGHSGKQAALFASRNVPKAIQERLQQYNDLELSNLGIWNALKLAFVDVSRSFQADSSGTTANVCLMVDDNLWIANVGDSRAILVSPEGIVETLSEDAKPTQVPYCFEIEQRGGFLVGGRVLGDLNIARSLGDHRLKGVISPRPKITKVAHPKKGSLLIQCCDGIFDVASSSQVGQFVFQAVKQGTSLEQASSLLVQAAFQANSFDNLSALISRI